MCPDPRAQVGGARRVRRVRGDRAGAPARPPRRRSRLLSALVALVRRRGGFPRQSRPLLGYAAVATGAGASTVRRGNGDRRPVTSAGSRCASWPLVRLLAVRSGSLPYLWAGVPAVVRGSGWLSSPTRAGGIGSPAVTFTFLAASSARHRPGSCRLREAQAGLAERARAGGAQPDRPGVARRHRAQPDRSLLHVSSARLAVEHDPADAARALAEAERLGRQSLDEVRATVGMPHSMAGRPAPPVPGVRDLARLVDQVSAAGSTFGWSSTAISARYPRRRHRRLPHRAGGAYQRGQACTGAPPAPWSRRDASRAVRRDGRQRRSARPRGGPRAGSACASAPRR